MTRPYDIFGPGGQIERATDIGPPQKQSDLSPTMHAAHQYALKNGGTLVRFPGGQWMISDQPGLWWGTSTIEGIVRRKYGIYTKWRDGLRGKFPIEVRMCWPDVLS